MRRRNFYIYKSNGGIEAFSRKKLFNSLKHSGLSNKTSQVITDKVYHEVREGDRTRDIYKKTLQLVKKTSPIAATHYSLKRAIYDLGPTGYHFETFVAKYFEHIGYKVNTCFILNGKLVKHEVDVIATKEGKRSFIECKFHNRKGIKNDIKIALYVKARWDDLKEGPEGKNLEAFYLASNTSFSSDAITYAKGTGLKLLGLNAPIERPFIEEIKSLNLYPITSLRRLNKHIRNVLLEKDIILAKDLLNKTEILAGLGMSENEIDGLFDEIIRLLEHKE